MILYGKYPISSKQLTPQESQKFECPPGGVIAHEVVVGHLFFIPFLPLEKRWVLKFNGQKFEYNRAESIKLDRIAGKPKTPILSYLGWILIVLGFGYYSLKSHIDKRASEKRYEEKKIARVNSINSAIDNPSNADYFYFNDSKHKPIVLKALSASPDSIEFLAPYDNENKKWRQKKWAVGYYDGDSPRMNVSLSKSDLRKSFREDGKKAVPFNSDKLDYVQNLILDKVEHINSEDTEDIPVIDSNEKSLVRKQVERIIRSGAVLDSLMIYMDSGSKEYYEEMLRVASMDDKSAHVELRSLNHKREKKRPFSLNIERFETFLYTKYVYLKTGDNQEHNNARTESNLKDLKGYLFFLSLLDRSFLTIEKERITNTKIVKVVLPRKNEARVVLNSKSNFFYKDQEVLYSIKLYKEDGEWKLSLPSTYSYGSNQFEKHADYSTIQKYIKKNVEEVSDGVKVSDLFSIF